MFDRQRPIDEWEHKRTCSDCEKEAIVVKFRMKDGEKLLCAACWKKRDRERRKDGKTRQKDS